MGANDAEERGQLIPQLPEELVLARIIPRLPWYTRPLCRALSKSWRTVLDTRNPELDLRTRTLQLPFLRDCFLFSTFDKEIFIRDHDIREPCWINAYQIQPHWRKLPPLRGLIAPPPSSTYMIASMGMVYVWSDDASSDGEGPNFVLKLDMGRADWTWNKVPVPYAFKLDTVSFNSKIYAPGISARSSKDSPSQKKIVLVHDMMTDRCEQIETWTQQDLRVLPRCALSNSDGEEMYGLVEEDFETKLQVFAYNVDSDSWRTQEDVPIPECRWSCLPEVKLLNSDCFEPAPDTGTNVIWIDHEGEVISWFNSAAGSMWVEFFYNPLLEGKYLEFMQFIHGSMYGIFCDEQEEEEEDAEKEDDKGRLSDLSRRSIMKGKLVVAENIVTWEEVHEVGFFKERYYIDSAVIPPIDYYTMMV